ncbi:Acetolactate synthase, catabolic [Staphylococcus aureus]|uniref:Acetolactate synthase, catabolic n=1 Tax=Staphylococcus aureus TaxID=1280 RepID=A0A380DUG6_STAAU|nr:Acetolactate synthase, catabolic [Staphylococcus aureus]
MMSLKRLKMHHSGFTSWNEKFKCRRNECYSQISRAYQFTRVETFQGAGVISRELENHFFGRVGLFRNQVGDELLRKSDLVVTIGYDPIEYEASNWNKE